jgi:hypothetical protein
LLKLKEREVVPGRASMTYTSWSRETRESRT